MMAPAWPSPFNVLRRCWICFPPAFRMACYRLLLRFSKWYYGNHAGRVQATPFGIYIKSGAIVRVKYGRREAEAAALKLVEEHTDIVAPRLIDYVRTDKVNYLVMTTIPGEQAYTALASMDERQKTALAAELRAVVLQLRRIPNPFEHAICNAMGDEVKDVRIWKDFAGPFRSEDELNDYNCLLTGRNKPRFKDALSQPHRLVFTHADLNTTNVMIKHGKFAGIIDFEFAGWWPEYWEYTKALYIRGDRHMWREVVEQTFTEDYSQELKIEEELWDITGPF